MGPKRYLVLFQYRRTHYSGAVRTPADQPVFGVQNYLEQAAQNLKPLVPIKFCISSETDAGVHALCNSAHVDIQKEAGKPPFPGSILVSSLNHWLKSEEIQILSACQVPDDFHARFSALSRTYIYRLVVGCSYNSQIPVFERDLCWAPRGDHLNVPATQEAVQFPLGTHDFSAFHSICATMPPKSPIKTLIHVDLRPFSSFLSYHYIQRRLQFWELEFRSQSFLYKQVQRMVGALVAVGQGKLKPYHIKLLLEVRDSLAYPHNTIALAAGLFLKSVEYDDANLQAAGAAGE
ncbi:PREDICTED: tRNA pseudouridine synthase-like 1 [Gavialis gangeticus]|uniref:tRNA pseudouridine synthase-like 1 n=1 Tax=Gavialis gangeticus TaxID=94835 RepID=UPI00092FD2E7|nr:PREDICTED: tRNA pseudouridine synthase-like 1 [Gavialis gangeticus]